MAGIEKMSTIHKLVKLYGLAPCPMETQTDLWLWMKFFIVIFGCWKLIS